MQIKKVVNQLINRYGTRDPYQLAQCLDIIVISVNLETIEGYFHYFKRNRIIYLNSSLSETRKRLVTAHELGHALLHIKTNSIFLQNSTYCIPEKYEKEADLFAAELLLPDNLKEKYPDYFSVEQIAIAEEKPMEYVHLKIARMDIK